MKRIALPVFAVAAVLAGIIFSTARASGHADEQAAPIYGVTIPPG